MSEGGSPKGYVINQYQFARRYKYNNHGFIDYFNSVIDRAKKNDGVYTSPTDYISVGEFDLLEIIKVNSFKKYHDVSEMAKDWVGKRQSVLLYDISDVDCPTNFYFDENGTRKWIDISGDVREKVDKRFFCLSMMSLTNEIIEGINDISMILKKIRRHILNLVYQVNEKCKTDIRCEVFGTFNTAEIGIIWLGDQYTDILRLIDFIKFLEFQDIIGNKCRAFFSSYSTMAFQKQTIKEDQNLCDLNGDAIIQMAIHDRIDNYKTIYEIYKQFCGDQNYELSYFVGEYDFGITMPASKVLHLITDRETKKFFVNVRVYETGMILYDDDDISKSIIRTNIKLLYSADAVVSLNNFFENNGNNLLNIQIDKPISAFKHLFENKELFTKEEYESYYPEKKDWEFNSVKSLYEGVRAKLKNNITSSAGAVDTLDLLYTDYKSVISSAYNAIWVSDFHRQFYSILFQINLLINSQNNKGLSNDSASTTMRWKWDQFQDLTNAFKQQIYHLSQSSRMFFETPNCHFRSTGQYDFLMHTYYGISKRIIETVYLMQKADPQSELVPLITVNTVPQVKSQLYFECGKSDEMRTINIDIPNSIIFDPYRGMCYLTHELFHYSVPESREKRNRVIGILFISRFFYDNVFYALKDIMITSLGRHSRRKEYETFVNVGKKCSTEQTEPSHRKEYEKLVNVFFQCCHRYFDEVSDSDKSIEKEFGVEKKDFITVIDTLDRKFLEIITSEYTSKVENNIKVDKNALSSEYQKALSIFCLSCDSKDLFQSLLEYLLSYLNKELCKIRVKEQQSLPNEDEPDKLSPEDKWKFIIERIKYVQTNKTIVESYIGTMFNPNDKFIKETDLVTANYLNFFNQVVFQAIKEARVDIAMVSLNDMSFEDYMLFCVQCFDDNHFFETCYTDMKNDEVVTMRIALVMEYFHSKKRNGWCLENTKHSLGVVIGFKLADETKKSFEKMYLWNYRSKFYKETKPDKRNQNYRKLYDKCQEWISYFEKSVSDFYRQYAKFYDDFFERIICDCDVIRKINDSTTDPQVCDRLSAIRKQFTDVHAEYITVIKTPFDNLSDSLENIQFDSDVDVKYVEDLFLQDLKTVSLFQEQKTLNELHDVNEEMKKACKSNYCVDESEKKQSADVAEIDDQVLTEFHAYSLDEFNFYVNYCIEMFNETVNDKKEKNPEGLQMRNADTVWFRGETNLKYNLNPALMREYDKEKEKKYGSLRRYHHSNYEEFKFRADGASEMPTGVRFTKSDYVALMQHYEIYTNFLDWTETLITSLYFALKYYFKYTDTELEKPENKKYKRDVCLYMFHPGVYNSFRRDVLKELSKKVKELDDPNLSQDYFTSVYSEESEAANLIPNLSTKENENIFDMFILGESSFDKFYLHNKNNINTVLKDNPSLQELFLPIAVWTSRLNSRIRTQSGCFVAFDLYSPQEALSSPGGKPYDSISLMSIQERHKPPKDKNQSNTIDRVFIYKIVIDKDCCREVVDWLKGIGVTAETVYPELEQLKGRFN